MSIDELLPARKKIVQGVNETIGIQENPVLKKLSEKDPTLRDLLERDKQLQKRIKDREAEINEKFQLLQEPTKKILRET
jgi:hypothetical protein